MENSILKNVSDIKKIKWRCVQKKIPKVLNPSVGDNLAAKSRYKKNVI